MHDAYGIFQGGGAKGYAHVGALKAAEKRGIRFIRIAGSSAGALVATLAAAGYTADELLDPSRPMGDRGVLDVDLSDILDATEYARVTRFLERYEALRTVKTPKSGLVGSWQQINRRSKAIVLARTIKLVLTEAGFGFRMYRDLGAVSTGPVVEWLDELLRVKVGGAGRVTFGDLAMKLRMVAANLTTGEVHKFGFPGDEELPVAAAAVASACFPFFFRPVVDGKNMFVDGGLVSNLPVWLFDDERDDDTSYLPTFGFRLINEALVAEPSTAPANFFPYARRMLQTLSSGSRNLEERRIDYYHGIDLKARIGTLSFRTVRAEAPRLVNEARDCVEKYFEREVGPQDPERMRRVLSLVVDMLAERYDWRGERIRAHVLLPDEDGRHARTIYCCNMDSDADDHLRVKTDADGVGAVFRLCEPVYVSPRPRRQVGPGALKYELSARPPGVSGLYAVPIFDDAQEWSRTVPGERTKPFAALVIDRESDFAPLAIDAIEQDTLANVAALVGEEIRDRTIVRTERNIALAPRQAGWDEALSGPGFRVALRKVRDPGDGELGGRMSSALIRLNTRAGTSLQKLNP